MFITTWLFDKLGYMPKVSVDTSWDFPVIKPAAKVAKKTVAKKKVAVKKTARKKA